MAGGAVGRRPRAAGAAARRALRRPRRARPRRRRRNRIADAPPPHAGADGAARASATARPALDDLAPRTVRGFNRWNAADAGAPVVDIVPRAGAAPPKPAPAAPRAAPAVVEFPVAASSGRAAYVAGTFDTKGRELFFLRQCLEQLGLRVVTVDLATSGRPSPASVHPREVARHHPQGEAAVFSGDRGSAVSAMALAFETLHAARGATSAASSRAGGSGGTTLATPAMRALPIGVPEGDGVDHGQRRHAPLRRPERHLHDVFGDRRAGHQPHQREGAGQRRACAGRHDRPPAAGRQQHQAGARA